MMMIRAHSFPWKILPNSTGQFAKFCGLPRQNRPNSAAHCGLPFVSKLSYILFKNFSDRLAGRMTLCSVMLATDKKNYLSFFVLKVQFIKLHRVYLRLCHIAIAISKALSFWQFNKSKIVLITGKFSTSAKFHGKRRENSVAWLKILRPVENSGP